MDLVQQFIEKAKSNPQRIVYPEGRDERIIAVAAKSKELGTADPILIGEAEEIKALAGKAGVDLAGVDVLSPREEIRLEKYADDYAAVRGVKVGVAKKLVRKPLSFAGMMLKTGNADGMVAGVASATASVIQAASLTVGFQEGLSTPSSFFIMIVPKFDGSEEKTLLFADCAVNIQPTARQLAEIGVASGTNASALLGIEPKVAFLSFATKGSAGHADVDKVIEAWKTAREIAPELQIDGELQADAAVIQRVAAKKVKESPVAGEANVLVFPDLDSGNMAYKLVQYCANAKAIGPILQGFAKPVNDMSRGASVDDLIAVTAITSVQAQNA